MNWRSGLLLLFLLFLPGGSARSVSRFEEASSEIRALWATRFQMGTREQIDQLVKDAAQAHFNTLFVQVRGRGEALYHSSLEPTSPLVKEVNFDPLAYVVQKAHRVGLEVHAWVNVFYVWSEDALPRSRNHVVLRHPDWVTRHVNGTSLREVAQKERAKWGAEGIFLEPGLPEVDSYLTELCRELWEHYAIDGIHLDYVRYPSGPFGFHPTSRHTFEQKRGIDPIQLFRAKESVKAHFGEEGYRTLLESWYQFRVEQVNRLVQSLSQRMAEEKPLLKLSAAVEPDLAHAKLAKGQAWDIWIQKGWIDFVVPMAYHTEDEQVLVSIQTALKIPHERFVVIGLGAWRQGREAIARKIQKIRAASPAGTVQGFSLFSYDRLSQEKGYLPYLRQTVFREPTLVPYFAWKPAFDLVQFVNNEDF